eukprot:4389145-Alexandrium_andersonii.AAC.1
MHEQFGSVGAARGESVHWPRHFGRLAPWARVDPSTGSRGPPEPPPSGRRSMGESALTEQLGAPLRGARR